jgi:hypothetical protein
VDVRVGLATVTLVLAALVAVQERHTAVTL